MDTETSPIQADQSITVVERLGVSAPVGQWPQTLRQQIAEQLPRQTLAARDRWGTEQLGGLFEQVSFKAARAHDGMVNQAPQKVGKTHARRAATPTVTAIQDVELSPWQTAVKQAGETSDRRWIEHVQLEPEPAKPEATSLQSVTCKNELTPIRQRH